MVRKAAALLFAVTLGAPAAHAEELHGTLHGDVRDAHGAAIASASLDITCRDVRRRTMTDAAGYFRQADLPLAPCTVTAVSPLFEAETATADATRHGTAISLILRIRRFTSEIVVTPARGLETTTFALPDAMSVTSRRDIDSRPHQLLAQVLGEEPGVLVQQTTSAQASPIIRGFTGQSNVYLVDGVRLNNASWRTGPSQYVAWVDGAAVDQIEVVRGSGSVQYGSDALGGTVQFLTAPSLFRASGARVDGTLEVTGGTADQSVGGGAEVAVKAQSASLRIGASSRRVGDLRAGSGKDSHAAVTRFLGLPSTVLGSRMPATEFDQNGAYGVAMVSAGHAATLRGVYMHERQTGVTRYDRVLGGDGLYRSGFDPQLLDFGLVRYQRSLAGLLDGISAGFSINRQADGRFEQARPSAVLDTQEATTTALGYQVQAHRQTTSRHQLIVGAELYDESIDGTRRLIQTTGAATSARPDIADGTSYTNLGLFAQNTVDVVSNRVSLRGGLRYSSFGFATAEDRLLGVAAEEVTMRSVTFQGATVVSLTDSLNFTLNVSRGFRAANAADLGNIGLTGGGGFEITPTQARAMGALVGTTAASNARSTGTPVAALGPEVVYQYDAGLKTRVGRFSGTLNVFDMEFFDAIQRRSLVFDHDVVNTTISGFQIVRQDAAGLAYIAQDVRPITTRVNVDRARIRGLDARGDLRVTPEWTATAYFSLSNGRLLTTGEYVRRMPPPMGGAKLRWTGRRVWAEGVLTFAAEQTRLSAADLGDARIGGLRTRGSIATFFNGTATDLGLVRDGLLVQTGETLAQVQQRVLGSDASAPMFTSQSGFAAFGLRAGMRLTPHLDVTALGDNLSDVNYRVYGSGLDAPGINVQVRMRYRF
jgi:hemoglobin/transferrin/lactoferrin receptor protein